MVREHQQGKLGVDFWRDAKSEDDHEGGGEYRAVAERLVFAEWLHVRVTPVVDDEGVELECNWDYVDDGVEKGGCELRLQIDTRFTGLSFVTLVYEADYCVKVHTEL